MPERRSASSIAGRIWVISACPVVVGSCGCTVGGGADGSGTHATAHIGAAAVRGATIGGAAIGSAASGGATIGAAATCVNGTSASPACMCASGTGAPSRKGLGGYPRDHKNGSREAGKEDSVRHGIPFRCTAMARLIVPNRLVRKYASVSVGSPMDQCRDTKEHGQRAFRIPVERAMRSKVRVAVSWPAHRRTRFRSAGSLASSSDRSTRLTATAA